jgi:hypothetical protein
VRSPPPRCAVASRTFVDSRGHTPSWRALACPRNRVERPEASLPGRRETPLLDELWRCYANRRAVGQPRTG